MTIPKQIQEAIIDNRLVVFVGSGLSARFNRPTWLQLVKDVITTIGNPKHKSFINLLDDGFMEPIEVLEKLKSDHNIIRKYISTQFNIKDGDFLTHQNIIELSGQIITTNYDNAFEKASNNSIIPATYTSNFNISEINKNNQPYIFKLHGSYTEPDHCIIFKNDYEQLYSKETSAKEKLKSIFTEKVILFLGFSFNDPDINLIFNGLDAAFGNNNKHFILTTEPDKFKNFQFLDSIPMSNYSEVDSFIDFCLSYKNLHKPIPPASLIKEIPIEIVEKVVTLPKIAILYPNPIDLNLKDELTQVINCFYELNASILIGTLNAKTLSIIDEDYDLLIIISKAFKSNLYVEDDNLKSNLLSPKEICDNIPNEKIPIIFITNVKIENILGYNIVNISCFKNSIINRFIYKTLRNGELDFREDEISVYPSKFLNKIILKGQSKISSIYKNDRDLEIGKKSLTNVVGRVEEQSAIALRLISITKSNKFLNIKASGGTGKTTLIKKVAYDLYNRGYYKQGVTFKSCENVKAFADFEEILIDGFNLTNILDFKDYLVENYSFNKIDLLVILDNFETVVNSVSSEELDRVINLLKFATDYANIVITSREKLSPTDDFEDVYSLTPLITDDALSLFQKNYSRKITNDDEIRILRTEILEDLLNNNPLAIKLVTNSRTSFRHISELKTQLKEHFFESTNEDFSLVFKNNADLNIQRTKSIYQSINYSYTTLSGREKLAFELLHLFPDGISLSNFKKSFEKRNPSSKNNKKAVKLTFNKPLLEEDISDKELRILKDKSLVEDYNGTLQLQPIIRRFAEYQFSKRPIEIKQKYYLDAYGYNCFVLNILEFIEKEKSTSEALKAYNSHKNNLLNVLSYIPDIELSDKGRVRGKEYTLNYICSLNDFISNEKQIHEFQEKLHQLQPYYSDLPNASLLVEVLKYNKAYYYQEFDSSYIQLSQLLSVGEVDKRVISDEDYIENLYKDIISNVHSMEGYTLLNVKSAVINDDFSRFLDAHFFYLGITNIRSRKKNGFYYFEYELMLKKMNINQLEHYISSLYLDEHLEIMQCTYILSKIKKLENTTIQKLVVTNPYTKGLKELMYAFNATSSNKKVAHFETALHNLSHIKYYYLECLYYYCQFLKETNYVDYKIKLTEGLAMSGKFYYQYLHFLFDCLEKGVSSTYDFRYEYYPLEALEEYVKKHNDKWEKKYKEEDLLN